jgi:cytochrome P450
MKSPPMPRLSMLQQTLRYVRDPLPLLDQCSTELGDLFMLRLMGNGYGVLLSAPEHLKVIFGGDPDVLHAGEANQSVFGPLSGPATLLTVDGAAHRQRRKQLQGPFHGERMRVYADVMSTITTQNLERWPNERPFALKPYLKQITMEVILRTIFGLDGAARNAKLGGLLRWLGDVGLGSPLLLLPFLQRDLGRFSPWGRVLHLLRQTDAALFAEIARRRAGPLDPEATDVASMLMHVHSGDGQPLSDQELRDELITLLLAGYETTSTTLTWVFERILAEPAVYERLCTEIRDLPKSEQLSRESLAKMDYLDAVIKEAMRYRPVMPVAGARKLTRPLEVGGYLLPQGALVTNCVYLVHRREQNYPDADQFRPERFLESAPHPLTWTPFGGGARRCIGAAFALYEIKVVVATVLAQRNLRLALDRPVRTVRQGFFLTPEKGLPVVASPSNHFLASRVPHLSTTRATEPSRVAAMLKDLPDPSQVSSVQPVKP